MAIAMISGCTGQPQPTPNLEATIEAAVKAEVAAEMERIKNAEATAEAQAKSDIAMQLAQEWTIDQAGGIAGMLTPLLNQANPLIAGALQDLIAQLIHKQISWEFSKPVVATGEPFAKFIGNPYLRFRAHHTYAYIKAFATWPLDIDTPALKWRADVSATFDLIINIDERKVPKSDLDSDSVDIVTY